ncbi:hypothetical protein ACFQ3P_32665 [Paraburkholderia sabiae]|uniref:Lipoprotein n=1 Tax=Paraburkholderia sabiae TaxID=273251 RepID=A0ABU9QIX5_9BURK|nr:hypothetical protein [Paraburkholderia sabiae]WJZ80013.1 hypothetical protein QEN71_43490 [Paraburkholderia sabiae]CAD6559525.1 hypothetical protein LMG24235_06699 [Paraburkholderia sabiae]
MKYALCVGLLAAGLTGCAMTQEELADTQPNARFVVAADYRCLYEKGAEKAASSLGMTEPKMSGYINSTGDYAWFRQPLTLIRLKSVGDHETEVTRQQHGSAAALGQGSDMLAYLRQNPCAAGAQ